MKKREGLIIYIGDRIGYDNLLRFLRVTDFGMLVGTWVKR